MPQSLIIAWRTDFFAKIQKNIFNFSFFPNHLFFSMNIERS